MYIFTWFLDGINGDLQANFIQEALRQLYAVGAIVMGVVFDGAYTNQTSAKELGVSFKA